MTSFIAACGSGRSTSVIPAVPAAWSVTTIAFMVIFLLGHLSLCWKCCRDGKPVRHLNGSKAVYLDVEPAVPGRDVDENPRGRVLREVPPIDFVNRREHLD